MWQTFLMILAGFVACCAGFSTICIAVGWLIKIIDKAKKPADEMKQRMKKQDEIIEGLSKQIDELKKQNTFMFKAISLLLEDDLAILNHLRTDNNTGEMTKQEQKVQGFLIEQKVDI